MRQPKPYYKKSHKGWYANIGSNKRPVRLASQEEGEQIAWDKYHEIMAGRQAARPDTPVVFLLDTYLEHCKLNKADSTYQSRWRILESFARYIGKLPLSSLKPLHVTRWINEHHNGCGPTTRHTYIRAVKGALKWSEDEGYIERSPIYKVKLPAPRSRDVYLMPEQWDKLVAKVAKARDKGCLLDYITALHDTGCRPIEARIVESQYFDRNERCWIFPIDESKGKREPRVVHLTDRAFEICQRLALKHPKGPIFRNRDERPWTRYSVHCRLYRLSKKLGFPDLVPPCTTDALALKTARDILSKVLAVIDPPNSGPLTVKQAAERLNVSPKTIYAMVAKGKIKRQKIGRAIRINPKDLDGLNDTGETSLKHIRL